MMAGMIPQTQTSSGEGHRFYLEALVRQEEDIAYRRQDYLAHEWQMSLWKDEVKESMQIQALRQSPSSVLSPTLAHMENADAPVPIPDAPSEICVRWREKIIEWKYQVVDRFDLDREIVSISTFYLDRYLATHYVDEELFQLVSMSSIYLAIKINSPKKVTIQSIASTGNGLITAQHIEAMELSIMKCLNWHLFPPTSVSFIENFFPLILMSSRNCKFSLYLQRKIEEALEFSRFLIELSVCAYPFVSAKPSSVAIAAILYSLESYGIVKETRGAFESLVKEAKLDANGPEVHACSRLLRRVHRLAITNDASSISG
mmetsp:Transcript_22450/g.47265  ORF Transcript_22450/g.47265 Transcript_22450/m.47265 type:complete len:316 (-) Transcript_22450:73-1020(-)